MKLKDKFLNTEVFNIVGRYLISRLDGECMICKDKTNFVDIYTEMYICSDQCQSELNERISNAIKSYIED